MYHQPKYYCKRCIKSAVVYSKESACVLTPSDYIMYQHHVCSQATELQIKHKQKAFRFLFMYPNEANIVWQIVQRDNHRHDRGVLPLSAGFKPERLGSQRCFKWQNTQSNWQCTKNGAEFQCHLEKPAVTRIRTGVAAATTQSTNHYTITARYHSATGGAAWGATEYHSALSALNFSFTYMTLSKEYTVF